MPSPQPRLLLCSRTGNGVECVWHWGPQLFLGLSLFPGRPGSLMVSEEGYSKLSENVAILVPGTPPFSEGGL